MPEITIYHNPACGTSRNTLGVKLCQPSEEVLEILPSPAFAPFAKEDGELVIDTGVRRV